MIELTEKGTFFVTFSQFVHMSSKALSVKMNNISPRIDCLIIGYFKIKEKEYNLIIPNGIAKICMKYYLIVTIHCIHIIFIYKYC